MGRKQLTWNTICSFGTSATNSCANKLFRGDHFIPLFVLQIIRLNAHTPSSCKLVPYILICILEATQISKCVPLGLIYTFSIIIPALCLEQQLQLSIRAGRAPDALEAHEIISCLTINTWGGPYNLQITIFTYFIPTRPGNKASTRCNNNIVCQGNFFKHLLVLRLGRGKCSWKKPCPIVHAAVQ